MYTIQAENHFDSAHFLKGYQGACSNLHGHRWIVQAVQAAENLIESGEKRAMVSDFGDLKEALKNLVDPLDHQLIFETGSISDAFLQALKAEGFTYVEIPVRPTAEALAKWFFDHLEKKVEGLLEVRVFETPTNVASYRRSSCI
jgi:6-pyruvoyltetrahydropterin/6-carboxytetrahydropterin synthase